MQRSAASSESWSVASSWIWSAVSAVCSVTPQSIGHGTWMFVWFLNSSFSCSVGHRSGRMMFLRSQQMRAVSRHLFA